MPENRLGAIRELAARVPDDPGILKDKTLHNLALSKMAMGDWPGARDAWERRLAMGGRPGLAEAPMEAALGASDLRTIQRTLL